MTHIPDPEEDFEGCIKALYDSVQNEIEGMTEEQKDEHFLMSSVDHLLKMYELDAPRCILKMAHESHNRHLRRLRDRARASRLAQGENRHSKKPQLRVVQPPSDYR